MLSILMDAKFFPSVIMITSQAQEAFSRTGDESCLSLHYHLWGDWGELDVFDREANELSL